MLTEWRPYMPPGVVFAFITVMPIYHFIMILITLLKYTIKLSEIRIRRSKIGDRLDSLIQGYLEQLRTLHSILPDDSRDTYTFDFINDKDVQVGLTNLLGAEDYVEIRKQVLRLRKLSKRFADITTNALRGPLQSYLAKKLSLGHNHERTHEDIPGFGKETASIISDNTVLNLSSAIFKLTRIPAALSESIDIWEEGEEAQELIIEAEHAVESMTYLVRKIPKSTILPNFDKNAVVACWELSTNSKMATGLSTKQLPLGSRFKTHSMLSSRETLLKVHQRTRVSKYDVDPGGKYRGICRLEMAFQETGGRFYYHGTGWLVDNSTVVTAAHNLYDPANGSSKASYACEVTVSIGVTKPYNADANVEKQQGKAVAIHWGWYHAALSENDIAVIKLRDPMKTAQPIRWKKTSIAAANVFLRVVGYPSDLPIAENQRSRGYAMYKSQGAVTYDLMDDNFSLWHNLDTFAGNSGSPILHVDTATAEFQAIGVHTSSTVRLNCGCALGHKGNDIVAFSKALSVLGNSTAGGNGGTFSTESIPGDVPELRKITVGYTAV